MTARNLAAWLAHIEQLHPKSIAMGLERVQQVMLRLALKPDFKIITVAGTNGKGSTCAMLSQIYLQAGYRVACYTSPHLLRYNERVRINNIEASDDDLCRAFAAVEQARLGVDAADEISLTYFEVGTLAAVWHFCQQNVDIAVLEIGLGGRLDAVNAFSPDCAVVTSVDIDHQEFLGNTRESIGAEKAGVYRTGLPAICGDLNPPQSLMDYAQKIHADFKCIGHDFSYHKTTTGWQYAALGQILFELPLPALEGDYQLMNAACAIAAVQSMQAQLPVDAQAISRAMLQVKLTGRFQTVSLAPKLILDVAHNPHAAIALAKNLKAHKVQSNAKTFAVFSMLADKDVRGVVDVLKNEIDVWYVASIAHVRSASVDELVTAILSVAPSANIKTFDSIAEACKHAKADMQTCLDGNENDKIIAFGSFFTVSNVMQYLKAYAAVNF
ncbi:MAG: bifunctional tetrahydrofolate synthase/dihydrofolate synthase [Methylotenera sp. 24-45-7]|jgi:dihydrofolate synthase/folylpolyglutamate synthase|nr:MAG: bifunctional tetrahydrofolate synthase/dihydrofolate synthase [Mehylophilales bacterium 35-46-6]OYZ40953.1 MAG: bifunctional tetrahydrofolate synthase/dihydrofolate synthase [Methylotenera sp. 24-45-7]OZA48599.1 MAG: bifunctional tetrahydrofolate synthase/dihydrofolate synthase [Methylophilales bacterium 39-45-7]HQS38052.1 bifunctional tetrahydrofolate synthase/dihydrofolate synthase [Methylotenera sp.]HQS43941.1 bifunctional tetrahydrofolate synthase/dihydrofolate synthase [Methylotene